MKKLDIYLTFNGNCEEAFSFYKEVFGGEYQSFNRFGEMPPSEGYQVSEEDADLIMHVSLPLGETSVLMGSDTSSGFGGPVAHGTNFSISISADSKEEADSLHAELSAGGQVTMPMADTFWESYFGMCTDQFGINWMVSFAV